jgi:hypothetical protein
MACGQGFEECTYRSAGEAINLGLVLRGSECNFWVMILQVDVHVVALGELKMSSRM